MSSSTSPLAAPDTKLYLTKDVLVEQLIGDIPFLGVGLLGFAIAFFLFIMARSSRSASYTIGAIITAFMGSLLDFNQLLARANGTLYLSNAGPLVIAREIAFALSITLRLVYFWYYSDTPPRIEFVRSNPTQISTYNAEWRGARWSRWGLAGLLVHYTLLAMAFAVGALQIVWRVSPTFEIIPYRMDAIFQLVFLAAILVKVLFNCCVSPVPPRWKSVRDATPILVAIIAGGSVGVGCLVMVRFSETSLGRFLQAIQLYSMAFFIMIAAFRSKYETEPQEKPARVVTPFRGLDPRASGSTFMVPAPSVSTPERLGTPPNQQQDPTGQRPAMPSRQSTTERLASWLTRRISSSNSHADREQVRLWNQSDAEALSPVQEKGRRSSLTLTVSPSLSEIRSWKEQKTANLALSSNNRVSMASSNPVILRQPRAGFRVTAESDGVLPSPIFGLNGARRDSSLMEEAKRDSEGTEALVRQEAALEESVAALQLLSPTNRSSESASSASRIRQAGSGRSEFSLSNFNFPAPPLSFAPRGGLKDATRSADFKESVIMDDVEFTMIQPTVRFPPAASLPRSVPQSMDVGGSDLDVTSFIGESTDTSSAEAQASEAVATRAIARAVKRVSLSRVRFTNSPLSSDGTSNPQTTPNTALGRSVFSNSSHPGISAPKALASVDSRRRLMISQPRLPIGGPVGRSDPEKPYEWPRPVPQVSNSRQTVVILPGKEEDVKQEGGGNSGFI